jgi:hypothetical protein
MTALFGIPILGDWLTVLEWAAIGIISAGVYVVSGDLVPRFATRAGTLLRHR